ncbi:hypothetical protein I5G62_gp85 [Mycobacterium phage CRB2]|uniref:Uncharacterized protein n=1 Tax=Mycobacterium phage CRB2 TaxID=2483623 RepID=A0A455M8H3_9CAUD|nr:hypothetical protein I5G62_gp85 [Mycobacterium phage CRB2]AYP70071.1 hypothetical protein CRB2_85 [Mycobacterium phage CRB2]
MSAQAPRRRCPGSGRVPAPPRTWRTALGGLRAADDRATCPACGKRFAHRADGRVRVHEMPQGQRVRLKVVTQK